ncbi:MAG: polysaccharide deacetylase family protein [Firmicutes bacterium]|nr:polysaccharide deacetylase family protein [Bacillota bacterium]
MSTLLQWLGFEQDDRVLILNCDDLGMCQTANESIFECLRVGVATSATVMVPCPWAYDAVQRWKENRNLSVGIHLTLTSEWSTYRWRPLLSADRVPGLVDEFGFMPRDPLEVQRRATPDEVYAECEAQIDMGLRWGLEPTHLDSHMGTLQTDPRFLLVYAELGRKYHLPIRMASRRQYEELGAAPAWDAASKVGIAAVDHLVLEDRRADEDADSFASRVLTALEPGVTEAFLHPSRMTPEIQAIFPEAAHRDEEFRLLAKDGTIARVIRERGIHLISYALIRDRVARGN